ncbi:hypothetical protein NDU88_011059 [Pleurodeles waltl]|uniref:Uncharacterized protein n=1 Tax=Pleurodeles waltl TaxID=8319 RepID=A0AAV7S511_PLEWA|nr:hypothetical protein NDU88_011059 [Pleurodeles waltl]
MQGPATLLSSVDALVTAEKGPGSPSFTGSPRFHCHEGRAVLPVSLTVLRSPLLRAFLFSSAGSGPLLLAPGGPREASISALRGASRPQPTARHASRLPESPARSRGLRARRWLRVP